LGEIDPTFAAARAEYAGKPDRLRDVDALLADLWATRRVPLQRFEVRVDEHGVAQPPVLPVLNVIGATLERVSRIEQRTRDPQHIHVSLMRHLVGNVVNLLTYYLPPEVLPEALDRLRRLQAVLPTPEVSVVPGSPTLDQDAMDRLPAGGGAAVETRQTPVAPSPPDELPTDDGEQSLDAPPELGEREVAEASGHQCGTCTNRTGDGWCRWRRFTVTPTLPACEFYAPIPPGRSGA
jgi:hypothetical protein